MAVIDKKRESTTTLTYFIFFTGEAVRLRVVCCLVFIVVRCGTTSTRPSCMIYFSMDIGTGQYLEKLFFAIFQEFFLCSARGRKNRPPDTKKKRGVKNRTIFRENEIFNRRAPVIQCCKKNGFRRVFPDAANIGLREPYPKNFL